jgi:hypothetical protein
MRVFGEKSLGSSAKKSTSAKCKAAKTSKTHSKTMACSDDLEQEFTDAPDISSPNEKKHRLIK